MFQGACIREDSPLSLTSKCSSSQLQFFGIDASLTSFTHFPLEYSFHRILLFLRSPNCLWLLWRGQRACCKSHNSHFSKVPVHLERCMHGTTLQLFQTLMTSYSRARLIARWLDGSYAWLLDNWLSILVGFNIIVYAWVATNWKSTFGAKRNIFGERWLFIINSCIISIKETHTSFCLCLSLGNPCPSDVKVNSRWWKHSNVLLSLIVKTH